MIHITVRNAQEAYCRFSASIPPFAIAGESCVKYRCVSLSRFLPRVAKVNPNQLMVGYKRLFDFGLSLRGHQSLITIGVGEALDTLATNHYLEQVKYNNLQY